MFPILRFIPILRFFFKKRNVSDPSFHTYSSFLFKKKKWFRSFVSYRYFVSFLKKEMVPILRFISILRFFFKKEMVPILRFISILRFFLKKEMVPILRFIPIHRFFFKKRNGSDPSFHTDTS